MINKKWIEKTKDYKTFVGNPDNYDKIGKIVFDLLIKLGLKPNHKLLDIGCGSLRVGRHLIDYLEDYHYFGIDPNFWLIEKALEKEEISHRILLSNSNDFTINNFIEGYSNVSFNYILCNSVFIHACKSQIEKVFSQLNYVLKDDGLFVFNYIQGDKDNQAKEWTYPSHICYTQQYIEGLLNKYNLSHEGIKVNYPGKQTFIVAKRK